MSADDKYDHVRRAKQTREHHCHWPGCERQVPPAMWGCKPHWFKLPPNIRRAIWRAYQPGQEQTGRPGPAYVEAAREAQEWIQEQDRHLPACIYCGGEGTVEMDNNGPVGPCPMCRKG